MTLDERKLGEARARSILDQIDRLRTISASLEVRLRQLETDVNDWYAIAGLVTP